MPAEGQDATVYVNAAATLRFAVDETVAAAAWTAQTLLTKTGLVSETVDAALVVDVDLTAADTLALGVASASRFVTHELWDGDTLLARGTLTIVDTHYRP